MLYFILSVMLYCILRAMLCFIVGDIKELIDRDFSSFDKFRELMSAKTVAIQGSGWGWLAWNPRHQRLRLTTCPNQDPVSMQGM